MWLYISCRHIFPLALRLGDFFSHQSNALICWKKLWVDSGLIASRMRPLTRCTTRGCALHQTAAGIGNFQEQMPSA